MADMARSLSARTLALLRETLASQHMGHPTDLAAAPPFKGASTPNRRSSCRLVDDCQGARVEGSRADQAQINRASAVRSGSRTRRRRRYLGLTNCAVCGPDPITMSWCGSRSTRRSENVAAYLWERLNASAKSHGYSICVQVTSNPWYLIIKLLFIGPRSTAYFSGPTWRGASIGDASRALSDNDELDEASFDDKLGCAPRLGVPIIGDDIDIDDDELDELDEASFDDKLGLVTKLGAPIFGDDVDVPLRP